MNYPARRVSQETDEFTAGIIKLLQLEIQAARCTLPIAMRSEADGYDHGALWVRKVEALLLKNSHQLAAMLPSVERRRADILKKYIVYLDHRGNPRIEVFSDNILHADMAIGRQVVSAGFVDTERHTCYGESLSIGIKSNPERDTRLLRDLLNAYAEAMV